MLLPCSIGVRSAYLEHKAGTFHSIWTSAVSLGIRDADVGESRVAVDTNAISVERSARLSLPIGDGGGQQLSCWCWRCDTAHWTQPRRKTDKVASEG